MDGSRWGRGEGGGVFPRRLGATPQEGHWVAGAQHEQRHGRGTGPTDQEGRTENLCEAAAKDKAQYRVHRLEIRVFV